MLEMDDFLRLIALAYCGLHVKKALNKICRLSASSVIS